MTISPINNIASQRKVIIAVKNVYMVIIIIIIIIIINIIVKVSNGPNVICTNWGH